jgi:hypothetical protein
MVYRMVPLRFIAILCVGMGLPYLTLSGVSEALQPATIPLRFAPVLYLFTTVIGVLFFLGCALQVERAQRFIPFAVPFWD